jgi:hypothetical protein
MRYFLIILTFFIGCSEKNHKKVYIQDVIPEDNITKNIVIPDKNETIKTPIKEKTVVKPKITKKIIQIKDLNFTEENNTIIYSFNSKKILLFVDSNDFSTQQIDALKKAHKKFYIINNEKLKKFFNIKKLPTMIVTKENNKTKKYEGYLPCEVIKYEIKEN